MRTTTTIIAAALAAALVLTGCSSRPDRADTVAGPTAEATVEATTEPTPAEETPDAETPVVEATTLSQEQIDAALLTQADMPEGWTQDAAAEAGEEVLEEVAPDAGVVYEPAQCQEILQGFEDTNEEEPLAQGKVSFSTEDYTVFAQQIETWDSGLNAGELDELVAKLSECAEVTQTDPDGTVTTSTISPLDMPNYGDRTLALRIAASSAVEGLGDITLTIDMVIVATGNVAVSFMAGGFTPVDPAALQRVISTAMTKIDGVA